MNTNLSNFKSLDVFEFNLGLFYQNLPDNFLKIGIDLVDIFCLSHLYFFTKLRALRDQQLDALFHVIQVTKNLVPLFFQNVI
jgi:hypothetical protein